MKHLPLSNGDFAIVDDDIYEQVKGEKWHNNHGYPRRTIYVLGSGRRNPQYRRIELHNVVIGKPPKGTDVDHINGNTLDARRENLRFVNRRTNCLNSNKRTAIEKYGNTWRFRYTLEGGIRVRVSGFKSEEEAASVAHLLKGALIYHELTKGEESGIG